MFLTSCALVAYGIVFAVKTSSFSAPASVPIAAGGVQAVLSLCITLCCTRRTFFLRLFLLVSGLLWIGQLAITILFFVPQTRARLIDTLDLQSDARAWVEDNTIAAGYIFAAMLGVAAIALVLSYGQVSRLQREERDLIEADYTPFISSKKAKESAKGTAKAGGYDHLNALADEEAVDASVKRYREDNAALYAKYGIKRT